MANKTEYPNTWINRKIRQSSMAALLIIISLISISCCSFSGSTHNGEEEYNFNGEKFVNQTPDQDRGFLDLIKWGLTKEPGFWRDWIDMEQGPPPPERVAKGKLRVTFINHSTLLVQLDSLNILTDPMYSDRASPLSFFGGPVRHRPVGIKFGNLPPIDVVVLSHNHYDHMDMPTLERLEKEHDPIILVGLGNKEFLKENGLTDVYDMDWWDEHIVKELKITFVPARHFSGRGLCDQNKSLWGGFVFESSEGPVYFAGDTGWGKQFQQIKARFGPIRFSMIPLGAYLPRWFMREIHVNPSEAVRAHRLLESQLSIGIHYGTFQQAEDGEDLPVWHLKRALKRQGVSPLEFRPLANGKHIEAPPLKKAINEDVIHSTD